VDPKQQLLQRKSDQTYDKIRRVGRGRDRSVLEVVQVGKEPTDEIEGERDVSDKDAKQLKTFYDFFVPDLVVIVPGLISVGGPEQPEID